MTTQRRQIFDEAAAITDSREILRDLRDSDTLTPFEKAQTIEIMLLSDVAGERWSFDHLTTITMIALLHYYGQLQIAEATSGIAENG